MINGMCGSFPRNNSAKSIQSAQFYVLSRLGSLW
jgi:hypothetical protein